MTTKLTPFLMIVLLPLAAAAQARAETAPLLNCWDGSFAYNTAVVKEVESQTNLLRVELSSENQKTFLKGIKLNPVLGWGQSLVAFYIDKSECKATTAGRSDLMTCETKNGMLEIEYNESQEARKILNLIVRDIKFDTELSGATMIANLTFDAGSLAPGEVHMGFRTEESVCRGLH